LGHVDQMDQTRVRENFFESKPEALSKGCHLEVVREPSTPHDPESDAGGSLSSCKGHPSR
jgi:hypothetical protein